jgi:hypothetical protein
VPPALHALIVGVSAYAHLPGGDGDPAPRSYGLRQLTATASSAARVAERLREVAPQLTIPLGTCRVLLSPSPAECARRPDLAGGTLATRENVRQAALAWREDCNGHRDNIALFYFAGHGVQRSRSDAVLLMRDFAHGGGNPLYNAVDVNNLFEGMAPTAGRPEMARTQLWFIDACRGFPAEFDNFEKLSATEVFEVELSDHDDRNAPVYFGALPGTSAYSITGEETIFCEAMLECLDGAAGQRPPGSSEWKVTVGSLLRGLQAIVGEINEREGGGQEVFDGGQAPRPDAPVLTLDHVPDVRVRLELTPPRAAERVALSVVRGTDGVPVPVPTPLAPNPFADRWPAGVYKFGATPPECGILEEDWPVLPPVFPWSAEVRA